MPRIFARFSGYFLAMSATIAMPLVQAETIVDTGPATGVGGQSIYHNNGAFQNLATAFTIDQPHVITDIHAWMYLSGNQGGPQPVSFLIYRSAGDRPDVSGELFAQTALVNSTSPSWQGLSGLNWNLGAGEYWIALEPQQSLSQSILPSLSVANPQPKRDFYSDGNLALGYLPGADPSGLRIEGIAVPEPSTASLIGLGGSLLLLIARIGARKIRR